MRPIFTTTTALVASLSLLVPLPDPVLAQGDEAVDLPECPADLTEEQCAALRAGAGEALPDGAAPEAEAGVEAESDAEAEAEGELPAETAAEPALEETPQDPAAEQPATEDQPEVTDPSTAEAPPAEELQPSDEEPPAEEAAEDMPSDAEGTAPAAESEAELEAELEAEAEGAAEAEAVAEPAAGAGPSDESMAETPEMPVEDNTVAEPDMPEEETPEVAEDPAPTPGADAAEADGTPVEDTAPTAAALDAAEGGAAEVMAGDAAEETGDVVDEVTETVTETDVRASDQDVAAGEEADTASGAADESGLSDIERALIGIAGAAVVGSILSGNREVVNSGQDRVVVRDPQGNLQVLRNDDEILRRPGSEVTTRSFADGSTQTTIEQPDGTRIITIRDPELRVLRRSVIAPNGRETVLFDDTRPIDAVEIDALPEPERTAAPRVDTTDRDALRAALLEQARVDRGFSLRQVRQIDRVRYLAPAVDIDSITFETGSAAIQPSQAEQLFALGQLMTDLIEENPGEVFLIEGHTDAVGSAANNLVLSDRRAESVALALTEYFGVSPANMVLQGYGESDLRVPTTEAERANRRVVVRRITPLLQTAQAD